MCYLEWQRDETRGLCQKRYYDDLEEPHAYCMFISIGLLPREMMSAGAHRMMSANAHTDEGVHEAHDTMGFRWSPDIAID